MKPAQKKILYIGFILLTLLIILLIGIRSGDFESSMAAVFAIPRRYVLLCLLCTFGGIFSQALSCRSALRAMGRDVPMGQMYAISILGEFYSFITPGASGGQPMQVYQMRKRGIPVGDATSALIMQYISYHFMLLVSDVVLGIANFGFAKKQIGVNWPFLLIGFLFNAFLVAMAVMLSFYQRPVRWLLDRLVALMRRLKLGDPEKLRVRFSESADSFYTSTRFMLLHRAELFKQLFFGAARLVCMMSVFYFVYRGLGQRSVGYGRILTLGVMQYTSAAYTPLPGASGAQEGIFSVYFDQLLPDELLLSGLLAWRFISYYLVLIVGFIVVTAMGMRRRSIPAEADLADPGK